MNSLSGKGGALAMRRALLKWYGSNARALPWRATNDPYAIWISEIMLQQTQVATVIPYYERFLRAFPTAGHLARASFESVAALWSGLGYYRRARHLHLAAKRISSVFGGHFPVNYDEARTLPGVGHYTASAVLSIAYGKPFAVLDGNVARVVARLYALKGNLQQPDFRSQVEQRLTGLLSRRKPGAFNQAMMELGQTVCLPRSPHCSKCPLRRTCDAFAIGKPESFPIPRPRRASELRYLAAAVIQNNGKVALTRGLEEGLLEDVWNFPSAFGGSSQEALDRLAKKLAARAVLPLCLGRKLGTTRHTITYRAIRVECFGFQGKPSGAGFRWFPMAKLNQAAVSQLARKIMRSVEFSETRLTCAARASCE
ncbi:MAG: A/G-specific adenine glycosylase [Terriglobia bacterium]